MNTRKRVTLALSLSIFAAAITPLAAFADRDDHREWRHERHEHYAPPPRYEFRHHVDEGRWHDGHWYHGYHGGRLGWWWVVAPGLWFWYAHTAYADQPPPEVTIVQPPVASTPPPAPTPTPTEYWYYCKPAKAYYPYVTTCPSGWQRVPATPGQ